MFGCEVQFPLEAEKEEMTDPEVMIQRIQGSSIDEYFAKLVKMQEIVFKTTDERIKNAQEKPLHEVKGDCGV